MLRGLAAEKSTVMNWLTWNSRWVNSPGVRMSVERRAFTERVHGKTPVSTWPFGAATRCGTPNFSAIVTNRGRYVSEMDVKMISLGFVWIRSVSKWQSDALSTNEVVAIVKRVESQQAELTVN
jgi:hypothetical protein